FSTLSTLPLDELIGNLKVYEVVLEKDSEISKSKKEKYKSLALKARKVLSEEEASSSDSEDEEYVMAKIKEDKNEKEDHRCFKCGDPNHFISDCPKHSYNDQKAFVVGCWSDSENDSKKEEICLMALDNNEDYLTKFDPKSTKGIFLDYSPSSKAYVLLNKETMRVEESLNVRFDKSPPPKSSPLVDDDILEFAIIENQEKDLEIKENEPLNKEIVNIKETKDHPIDSVVGNLNERTLRSQVQNQSNFFCFVSSIKSKNVKEAIQDESWTMAMQEELNQFKTKYFWSLVPPPDNQTIIGTKWVFKNKLDENDVVSRNKARLVA
ncbi:retrovirus-related pol polyprotein from transposon TNT 1-94, partial [Tanacetum coccineum]